MRILAGPYRDKPTGYFGVKLAAEIKEPCDVEIPSVDFGVPSDKDMIRGMLLTYVALTQGSRPVYAGCMGGIGRTGTFLACMVKLAAHTRIKGSSGALTWIESDWVAIVRDTYLGHAVETPEQHALISGLDVRLLAAVTRWA